MSAPAVPAGPSGHGAALWIAAMPVLFVLIWSTGFVSARLGMPHATPFTFLCWRYGLSVLAFLPWIALAGAPWPKERGQWLHLAVAGVLMHAGYLGGVWAAVKLGMGAGLTALIVGLQPVLTALWVSASGAQARVSTRQWLGLASGLAGLLLVVWHKLGAGEVTAVNLAWAVAALLCITGGTLYQKRYVKAGADVRTANTVQLLAALLVSLPLAWLEPQGMQPHPQLWVALGWSVLGLTLGGSSLLFMLIQRGAATQVTSLLYLVPPSTAVMAWFLFDEPLGWLVLAGMALTALGVWLVVKAPAVNPKPV